MGLLETVYRNWMIERPAGKRTPAELADELEASGREIEAPGASQDEAI